MREPHVHQQRFDGDDPYLVCDCGARWDALTGREMGRDDTRTPAGRLRDAISGERRYWHVVEVSPDDLAATLDAARAAAPEPTGALRHDVASLRATAHEQIVTAGALQSGSFFEGQVYAYDEVLRRLFQPTPSEGLREALLTHEPSADYAYESMGCTCGWRDSDAIGVRPVDPESKTWVEHILRAHDAVLAASEPATPESLDAAWAEAEAALPLAGWTDPLSGKWVIPHATWAIDIRCEESGDGYFEPAVEGFCATAKVDADPRPFAIRGDLGPTPADALRSLAASLRSATPTEPTP